MDKKGKKLMNNTFLFFIGNVGSKFIQFLLVPLYTYTLTTTQFGITDIFFTTINFLVPVFSIQVSDGLLRFGLSKENDLNNVISSSFKIMFIGTLLSIILSPLLFLIPSLKEWTCFFVIILNLQIYRDLLSIVLKIKDLNKKYVLSSLIYTISLCILNILFLVYLKLGVVGYFLSFIIANIVSIIYLLMSIDINFKIFISKCDRMMMKKITLYSLPLVMNSISYWITTASDRYMINAFFGVSSVGLYAIACKIPTILTTISSVFNQAWMISSIDEYENEKDSSFYSNTFDNYTGISMIICSILILFLKPFMLLYVSSEYYIAWRYSTILILSAVFSGICAFINGIFYAYKKNISITVTTTLGAITNIILNLILIPIIGIMGAALATLISWGGIAFLRICSIKKIVLFNINMKKFIISTILVIIEIILINLLSFVPSFILNMIIVFILLYIEKNTLFRIFKIFKSKKKEIVKKIKKYIRRNYDLRNINNLENDNFTIICSNCTAGIIYHNLGKKFCTPTINLYFEAKDFIKFCKNINYYLSLELKEVSSKETYPIALLGDLKLFGVHYKNFTEMKNKWNERKKRINKDNMFFMMTERDGCTYDDLIEYDSLDFCNKVVFTHKAYENIKCSQYIKGTNNKNEYHKTKSLTDYKSKFSCYRFIDDWDYVEWLNTCEEKK